MPNLYHASVRVSRDYLGPAGERFMRRQIETHLDIEPEKLARKHVPELIEWVGLTLNVVTDDKNEADEFVARLQELARTYPVKTTTKEKASR